MVPEDPSLAGKSRLRKTSTMAISAKKVTWCLVVGPVPPFHICMHNLHGKPVVVGILVEGRPDRRFNSHSCHARRGTQHDLRYFMVNSDWFIHLYASRLCPM